MAAFNYVTNVASR